MTREELIELPFLISVQVYLTRQQQPAFPLHHFARCPAFAEELGSPYFIYRGGGMLHDVERDIDDASVFRPRFDALPEQLPHVYAGGPDRTPLQATQLRLEDLIQRLFLPLPAEPQWLPGFQVTDHTRNFCCFPR